MAPTPITIPAELVELLDDDALSLHELARGSRVTTEWVLTHVEAGVLQPQRGQAATGRTGHRPDGRSRAAAAAPAGDLKLNQASASARIA